jgi:hypothetical protein
MPVVGKTVESTQLDFTAGSASSDTFRVGTVSTVIKSLTLTTTADVYVNFNADADDTCFVVQAGCPLTLENLPCTTISALGVTGGGTLYLLAVRG